VFFQAEDGIRDFHVTGVQTCALPILRPRAAAGEPPAPLGTRTETKNVNSMRSVERAVRHEIQRQAAILAAGGTITQETRHWHEEIGRASCRERVQDWAVGSRHKEGGT